MTTPGPIDVLVVGGGIAGLAAAAFAARAGAHTVLLEGALSLGGRARTRDDQGYKFNHGAHAFYLAGAGKRTLDPLGIDPAGAAPPLGGALVIRDGTLYTAPPGLGNTAISPVMSQDDHLALTAALSAIADGFAGLPGESISAALSRLTPSSSAQTVLKMLVRLASFTNAPDRADANAMLDQIRLGNGGARYLHEGWGAMLSLLADCARAAGARNSKPLRG